MGFRDELHNWLDAGLDKILTGNPHSFDHYRKHKEREKRRRERWGRRNSETDANPSRGAGRNSPGPDPSFGFGNNIQTFSGQVLNGRPVSALGNQQPSRDPSPYRRGNRQPSNPQLKTQTGLQSSSQRASPGPSQSQNGSLQSPPGQSCGLSRAITAPLSNQGLANATRPDSRLNTQNGLQPGLPFSLPVSPTSQNGAIQGARSSQNRILSQAVSTPLPGLSPATMSNYKPSTRTEAPESQRVQTALYPLGNMARTIIEGAVPPAQLGVSARNVHTQNLRVPSRGRSRSQSTTTEDEDPRSQKVQTVMYSIGNMNHTIIEGAVLANQNQSATGRSQPLNLTLSSQIRSRSQSTTTEDEDAHSQRVQTAMYEIGNMNRTIIEGAILAFPQQPPTGRSQTRNPPRSRRTSTSQADTPQSRTQGPTIGTPLFQQITETEDIQSDRIATSVYQLGNMERTIIEGARPRSERPPTEIYQLGNMERTIIEGAVLPSHGRSRTGRANGSR